MGIEEELLLIDGATGRPIARAGDAVRHATQGEPEGGAAVGGSVDGELQLEQLEIDTPPQTDLGALSSQLRAWRGRAVQAGRDVGAQVAALGTSPLPVRPTLAPSPRFLRIAERFGLTAREELISGCHVHVSVDSLEEAVGVIDRIRIWLPALLALSANSPFWQGQDSGYASFRSQVWLRWPSAGPSELFGSADGYRRAVEEMIATGVVLDEKMVYLDARASSRYPTVEVRAADVCLEVEDAVLVAGLCRGLVETAAHEWQAGEPAAPVTTSLLRLARWQAGRDGLDGELLDPWRSTPRPARDVVEAMLEHVRPALARTGDEEAVETRFEQVLSRGTGARRQREVFARSGDLSAVVADAVRVTAGHR
ncbi:glutamate--cysteine ligase [Actinotalea sp. K2]|uniref:carboxylate-amine ligase n=1 Tax=Actinotalea sp. K2 TaxID=2939438 RepID=UPI002016FC51|nr:glutamate--cysteine ligase [Actinotalea sp. K2]MCL3862253.1 glutamate--cysteine ligase [Actinotalea sp. K2]